MSSRPVTKTKVRSEIRRISALLEAQLVAVDAEVARLAAERGATNDGFDKPEITRKPWLGETLPKLLTLEQITWDLLGNLRTDIEDLRYRLVDLRFAAKQVGIAQRYIDELGIVEDTQVKLFTLAAKYIELLANQLKTSGIAKGEIKTDAQPAAEKATVLLLPQELFGQAGKMLSHEEWEAKVSALEATRLQPALLADALEARGKVE